MTKEMGSDRRFPQADREAWITLALYGLYFVWWYICAYGLGGGDPESYSYVFGFPAWFFYGCVLGYPVLTLLLWLVVRCCFRDLSLEAEEETPPCSPGEQATGGAELRAERSAGRADPVESSGERPGVATDSGRDGGGCR